VIWRFGDLVIWRSGFGDLVIAFRDLAIASGDFVIATPSDESTIRRSPDRSLDHQINHQITQSPNPIAKSPDHQIAK
jgi:hypothetical protein